LGLVYKLYYTHSLLENRENPSLTGNATVLMKDSFNEKYVMLYPTL